MAMKLKQGSVQERPSYQLCDLRHVSDCPGASVFSSVRERSKPLPCCFLAMSRNNASKISDTMPDTKEVLKDNFMRILSSWSFSFLLPWILHSFECFLLTCFTQAGSGQVTHWVLKEGRGGFLRGQILQSPRSSVKQATSQPNQSLCDLERGLKASGRPQRGNR